ncbi:MAG: hypothetical protein NTU98_12815 [Bacteroidetes bacterium]|nr:hypothetical protein [Bacteroidota bacterium]
MTYYFMVYLPSLNLLKSFSKQAAGLKIFLLAACFLLPLLARSWPEAGKADNNPYKKSLAQYFKALMEDEKLNDLAAKAEDLNSIGNIHFTLKEYSKALDYYRKSQETYLRMDLPDAMYEQAFSISRVLREMKKYDSAWLSLSSAIRYFRITKNNSGNLMNAYYFAGELFRSEPKAQLAQMYYDSAMTLATKNNRHDIILVILTGKSELYLETQDCKKSIEFAQQGLAIAAKTDDPVLLMRFHQILYKSYKLLNKQDQAFQNLEAYYKLNDSMQSLKNRNAMLRLTESYNAVSQQTGTELIRQQNRNFRLAQKFYISAAVFALLLIVLLSLLVRQQRKNLRFKNEIIRHEKQIKGKLVTSIDQHKTHKDELISTHKQALEAAGNEVSQVTAELERKNHDLLMATTYMIKTNEKLAEISANFRDIASRSPKTSSLNGEIYQTIEAIEKLTTKDTWDSFKAKFVDVHPNFFKNLNDKCPGLTSNEMKLAAMISMNLSSKDIAKITLQQHNSVNVARYRLRKKLNMESDDQLIGFLLQL